MKKLRDNPLYYRVARDAVRAEQTNDFLAAARLWGKAGPLSRLELNRDWSEKRVDFCVMQADRERQKAVANGIPA